MRAIFAIAVLLTAQTLIGSSAFAENNSKPHLFYDHIETVKLGAERGDTPSQKILGDIYRKNEDYKNAAYWYRKAATRGNASAQWSLGVLFDQGLGIPQDYKEAFHWYRKSASQGNEAAMGSLGFMYSLGLGVKQNNVIAYALLNLSGKHGMKSREMIRESMTSKQIKNGQELTHRLSIQGQFIIELDKATKSK